MAELYERLEQECPRCRVGTLRVGDINFYEDCVELECDSCGYALEEVI